MERFVKGDVIVTPFPFSDLTSSMKRPALIVATLPDDDLVVCQITTKRRDDPFQIELTDKDFTTGKLKINSFIRTSKLLSIRKSIVLYKIGSVKSNIINDAVNKIIGIFRK